MARRAQPGAAAPAQPGEWRVATGGVRGRQGVRRGAEQRRLPPRLSRRGIGGSEPGPWAREASGEARAAHRVGTRRSASGGTARSRSGDDRHHGGRGEGTGDPSRTTLAERSGDGRRHGGRGEESVDPSRVHRPEERSGAVSPAERSGDGRRHDGRGEGSGGPGRAHGPERRAARHEPRTG